MIENGFTVAFAPLVPWLVLIVLGALTLAALAFTALRRAHGVAWRLLAAAALWLTLANPALVNEKRELRKDVGVVIVDESASQTIGKRKAQTEAALARLVEQAKQNPDLELRVVRTGADAESFDGDGGTRLFQALDRALSDVPRRRFAGAILITDGQVHDVPKLAQGEGSGGDATKLATGGTLPPGPIHALITGAQGEVDRRIVVVRAPTFGLVDKPVTVTIRIEDSDSRNNDPVAVTMRRDGGAEQPLMVPANRDFQLDVPIQHGGQTIIELAAAPGPRELTTINNNAVVAINGIRDRLRVLLISGEPHAGERTWRNLLKSDPSVDLVHFTILRPPEKQDGTPINELSLIAFPIRELFEVKLHDFDLIIFDRYKRRNILPRIYIQAIAKYVEDGGAVLEAAGPSFASPLSLFNSPLGELLPGEPTGKVYEQPFKAQPTDVGKRHPVTADLGGSGSSPSWGRWFRHIEVTRRHGEVVLSGVDNQPLLLLDRVGQGRIAQLVSDHIWLWSRGYDGGGPQAELLRRLAHWLMKEPALEEEDLRAETKGGRIEVTRRSLKPDPASVKITDPLGEAKTIELGDAGAGRQTARVPFNRPGLYRIEDGQHTALAAVGSVNPKEFADVRATTQLLAPIANASGGGLYWIGNGAGPELRRVREERATHGREWLALIQRRDYDVTGVEQIPLLPAALVLMLAVGGLMLAWRREGR
ncbi:MAG: hypothetical protein HY060_03835 [Proteobacteria bacterium]|nr:hypothetical protein [Pseudomonadota bacterium]